MNKLKKAFVFAKNAVSNKKPEILIGIGTAGLLTAIPMAVRATPSAMKHIDEEKERLGVEELTLTQKFKVTWRDYIWTAATATGSTMITMSGVKEGKKQNAILSTAVTMAENNLSAYQSKTIEKYGEEAHQSIVDEIEADKMRRNPYVSREVLMPPNAQLYFESLTTPEGRYFISSDEEMNEALAYINNFFGRADTFNVSVNEFWERIMVPCTELGDKLKWSADDAPLTFKYSAKITEDGRTCKVVGFNISPRYLEY